MRKFRLCSEGKCCPEVVINDGIVTITDDEGGMVRMTEEQLNILKDKIS